MVILTLWAEYTGMMHEATQKKTTQSKDKPAETKVDKQESKE